MPDDTPREQLARIAAAADDLDKLLDKLFRNVAELKEILASTSAGEGEDRP
jgi:hypothetical protein